MKILKPVIGGHDGSSFREILDIWAEMKLCEVIPNRNIVNYPYPDQTQFPEARPWINAVGDIMLYDQPILDKLHGRLSWNFALWANETGPLDKGSVWTFWPWHPRVHTKMIAEGIPSYDERPVESIFIGTNTTSDRVARWSLGIEQFVIGHYTQHPISHADYLNRLRNSKFGLCLRGIGPKCLRDMELMGFGTVPIFTPGVSTDYFHPLVKDQHYLYAANPAEVAAVVKGCSKARWEDMSNECRVWYDKNASPFGVFNTTCEILSTHGLRY